MSYDVTKEIKYSSHQAILSVLVPIVLIEPFLKLVRSSSYQGQYLGFIFVFFILGYVFWNHIRVTVMMLYGTPAIIMTRKTITITKSGYTIEWKDIEAISLGESSGRGGTHYTLELTLKDPWKYISQLNPLARYFVWYLKDYIYPFNLSLSILEGDSVDAYNTIEGYYYQYKHAQLA